MSLAISTAALAASRLPRVADYIHDNDHRCIAQSFPPPDRWVDLTATLRRLRRQLDQVEGLLAEGSGSSSSLLGSALGRWGEAEEDMARALREGITEVRDRERASKKNKDKTEMKTQLWNIRRRGDYQQQQQQGQQQQEEQSQKQEHGKQQKEEEEDKDVHWPDVCREVEYQLDNIRARVGDSVSYFDRVILAAIDDLSTTLVEMRHTRYEDLCGELQALLLNTPGVYMPVGFGNGQRSGSGSGDDDDDPEVLVLVKNGLASWWSICELYRRFFAELFGGERMGRQSHTDDRSQTANHHHHHASFSPGATDKTNAGIHTRLRQVAEEAHERIVRPGERLLVRLGEERAKVAAAGGWCRRGGGHPGGWDPSGYYDDRDGDKYEENNHDDDDDGIYDSFGACKQALAWVSGWFLRWFFGWFVYLSMGLMVFLVVIGAVALVGYVVLSYLVKWAARRM